jgi:hypothetical protein
LDLRVIGWGVERIQLALDRDRWQAIVNMVMNFRVLAPRSWLVSLGTVKVAVILPLRFFLALWDNI